ncbi:hypothetical protein PKU16_07510 [Weissella cibaria]|uniref:hypothetical protein n=1 Tax=Weissella cibaria TaxID=137591 RepID=UPI0023081E6A|nr:hypothetical protein [Weissella cibaria]WCE24277.1 hypothetical protein PKU16_07510 [Weissella cibaria]WCE26465.1 hypothetical protein PKU15_07510 [Weissella cibaria]
MSEMGMIISTGEKATMEQLTDSKLLAQVDNETLEELKYTSKMVAAPAVKAIDAEVKRRLDEGVTFDHAQYRDGMKTEIPDSDSELKRDFVERFGWDAVSLKTPNKLKAKYGEVVDELLNGHTVQTPTKTLIWK